MKNKNSHENLILEYARLSDLYGDAIETGNHKKANKAYDELMAVYQQIKAQGALTSEDFYELLFAPSMGTRLWAATHYLVISHEKSEKVLTALGEVSNSLLAVSAKMTLDEWKKGNLIL